MTLGQFQQRLLRQFPQITSQNVDPTQITFELNHACDEINLIARCLMGTLTASLPASSKATEFSLSSMFPGYLGVEKTGLWFYDTSGASHYIYAKTKRWLDLRIRNWRDNQGGSVPTWSYIRNDLFAFYPYVNISGTTVGIDCLLKAQPMTNNSNYPWTNSATEITTLRPFDNAIAAYAGWKLAPAVYDKESRNVYQQEFLSEVKVAMAQVKNNPTLTSDDDYYLNTDIAGGGSFLPR